MTNVLMIIELFFTIIIFLYFINVLKSQQFGKSVIKTECSKQMDKLNQMREINLTTPLSEKIRPSNINEVIGQEKGIKILKAALCSSNPQNVIIYGPPGIGKTAAARLILEEAKKSSISPFNEDSKFIEIDATTIRFDDRGVADPLIGSVHDPIYQGAGQLGIAGIPQPQIGAVTKAHGGVLFIDEIGELHPIEMNKLLKVLEDRKVFLDSVYYNSENPNIPNYIKEVFENGMPADFRLIGATTKNPEEISPALRSRCIEVFFRQLHPDEIQRIVRNSIKKMNKTMGDDVCVLIGKYASNGREAVNLVELACGIATNNGRDNITVSDVEMIIENGQYSPAPNKQINKKPQVGYVNGLAVYGAGLGIIMEIEAIAKKVKHRKGNLKVTGVVEEEEISSFSRKIRKKSSVQCSIENVISILEKIFDINCDEFDLHINFPGGVPVDGPSAGISIAVAVYSAIMELPIDNNIAMTGEISLYGNVKPVGGINSKIEAAIKAGASKVIIPKENWQDNFNDIKDITVIPVIHIKEVINIALIKNRAFY